MRRRVTSGLFVLAVGFVVFAANVGAAPSALGKIAFVSNRDGGIQQIYLMNTDGSDPTRIATPIASQCPAFSPDGRRIIFVGDREGVYVMDVDGSHLTKLIKVAGEVACPVFSPDGRRIAFGADQVYLANADGSHLARLTNLPGGAGQPAFSPDSRRIAFAHWDPVPRGTSADQIRTQVYLVNVDGSHVTRLTNLRGGASEPNFSPDGRRILFVSDREGLYIMDVSGSHMRFIPIPGALIDSPKFSPDGRKIVFAYYDTREHRGVAGIWQIYIMDADGSRLTRLTKVRAFNMDPAFAP